LAASPQLHAVAHDFGGSEQHQCLATVLQNGGCDNVQTTPVILAFVTTRFEAAFSDSSRTVESLFLSCRILEHAPPVIS
jgi:hypothetical protein